MTKKNMISLLSFLDLFQKPQFAYLFLTKLTTEAINPIPHAKYRKTEGVLFGIMPTVAKRQHAINTAQATKENSQNRF